MAGAYENTLGISDLSNLVAGADLSTHQYKFVTISSDSEVVLPTRGGRVIGVLQNAPSSGQTARVRAAAGTISRIVTSSTVALANVADGLIVTPSTLGTAIAASTGQYPAGILLQESTAGDGHVKSMIVQPTLRALGST